MKFGTNATVVQAVNKHVCDILGLPSHSETQDDIMWTVVKMWTAVKIKCSGWTRMGCSCSVVCWGSSRWTIISGGASVMPPRKVLVVHKPIQPCCQTGKAFVVPVKLNKILTWYLFLCFLVFFCEWWMFYEKLKTFRVISTPTTWKCSPSEP